MHYLIADCSRNFSRKLARDCKLEDKDVEVLPDHHWVTAVAGADQLLLTNTRMRGGDRGELLMSRLRKGKRCRSGHLFWAGQKFLATFGGHDVTPPRMLQGSFRSIAAHFTTRKWSLCARSGSARPGRTFGVL